MRARFHLVDTFTDRLFGGNPTAVLVLPGWPDDATLRALAMETGQTVTGFLVDRGERAEYRVLAAAGGALGLVGHTSLAAAFVLLRGDRRAIVLDHPAAGSLTACRDGDRIALDFAAMPGEPVAPPPALCDAIGVPVRETLVAPFGYVAVLDDAEQVRGLDPDLARVATLDRTAAIYTAAGRDCDFVSRVFAPQANLPEDPVCGTAHRILVPYWAARLGRDDLLALQLSSRGGAFRCRNAGDRTILAGQAVAVVEGTVDLP